MIIWVHRILDEKGHLKSWLFVFAFRNAKKWVLKSSAILDYHAISSPGPLKPLKWSIIKKQKNVQAWPTAQRE